MAETPKAPSKVEENKLDPKAVDPTAGLFTLEKLDDLINESDPEFNKTISQIAGEAGGQDLNFDLLDLDSILAEQEAGSLKARFKRLKSRVRGWIIITINHLKTVAIEFIKEGLPQLLKKTKSALVSFFEFINEALRQFSYWPTKKKIATFGLITGVGVTVFYVYAAYTRDLLPIKTELFVASLEELAEDSGVYDSEKEIEPFYDSSRASQNMMSLSKMVVNLLRSPKSGPNPMGAFEFYLEGNSPDVMVEIKDREYEVQDVFQRTIEEMTFDNIDTQDGKQLLLEKLRREINRVLTKGRIRKIFFKTAIIKP